MSQYRETSAGSDPKAPERGIEKEKSSWEGAPDFESFEQPIELLKPGSERHRAVLQYLLHRLQSSEDKMAQFYHRWRVNEQRTQAYIDLPDWEKIWKSMNEKGKKPVATSIVVPYQFATISTIVTYLLHTFTGRKPMFQVGSRKQETANSSRLMEQVLQYNAEHTRLIQKLYTWLYNSQQYGVGALRILWDRQIRPRTVTRKEGDRYFKYREHRVVYEGNDAEVCDPFMFFPDPRVPMHEVNKKGEFVFWRAYEGRHMLKRGEADGTYRYVDNASQSMPQNKSGGSDSASAILAGGDSNPGAAADTTRLHARMMQIDQGTVEIIPAELGLGEAETPEKWLFTILNKSQIIQAEPFDADHEMHPVAVTEPYIMGQSFGAPSVADFIGPLQDVISWLVNSHQDNVRKVLNDMLIVDPSRIEMQDLVNPGPGGRIRLKESAYGTDVRSAISQLDVRDVTQNHIRDAELFMRLGQQLSAVTDNVMGMQQQGGRKTATEVRTTTEAAASRLAAQARIISAQGVVDLTEMMSVNNQQYLNHEFFLKIVGKKGKEESIHINPEQLSGDFYYPVHDGTLPLDRVALFEIWGEMFQTVQQDQELRQNYDMPKMFEQVAELGGIRNMEGMKLDVRPNEQLEQQAQAGNAVPIAEALEQLRGAGGGSPTQQNLNPEEMIGLG